MTDDERIELKETIAMNRAMFMEPEDYVNFFLDAQIGYLDTLTDEQLLEMNNVSDTD